MQLKRLGYHKRCVGTWYACTNTRELLRHCKQHSVAGIANHGPRNLDQSTSIRSTPYEYVYYCYDGYLISDGHCRSWTKTEKSQAQM